MKSKQRSHTGQKLMIIILLSLTILSIQSFSPDGLNAPLKQNQTANQSQLKIGKILWKGNSVYDTKTLNNVLGLKEGSAYNKTLIEDRLFGFSGAQDAVINLYQDNGYVYSSINISEDQNKDIIDLTMSIYEGKQAKINDITVKINGVVIKDPVSEIGINSGELYSKTKIINSIKALNATGKFDPKKINPKPLVIRTSGEYDTVDLVYELTEITK